MAWQIGVQEKRLEAMAKTISDMQLVFEDYKGAHFKVLGNDVVIDEWKTMYEDGKLAGGAFFEPDADINFSLRFAQLILDHDITTGVPAELQKEPELVNCDCAWDEGCNLAKPVKDAKKDLKEWNMHTSIFPRVMIVDGCKLRKRLYTKTTVIEVSPPTASRKVRDEMCYKLRRIGIANA